MERSPTAEHGDRTGSANTLEKSISRERTGEIGYHSHVDVARIRERGEVRRATRFYAESIEVQSNGRVRRISKIRSWSLGGRVRGIENDRLARSSEDPRDHPKDDPSIHSIAVVEDALGANDARRSEDGSLEIASDGYVERQGGRLQ